MRTYTQREMNAFLKSRKMLHGVFTAKHYRHDPVTGEREAKPYKVFTGENSIVNGGGLAWLNLLIGAGGTPFDNTHSYFGVGDDNTATAATMTDLQGALAATVNIASSTNASPIVLTTSAAHGYTAGDTITVDGHLVNTSANGTWVITVPTGTTIGLVGSVGVGVGAGTGTTAKGNRFRVPVSATFPSITGQVCKWEAVFGPGQAEWATGIKEGAVFNGFVASASTMLARTIQNLGVKAPGTSITLDYSVHCP